MEPNLREQFEMPRPSPLFRSVLAALPDVFVGTEARLETLVTWLAERVRDAFAAAEMALPPWRQPAALLARWHLDTAASAADEAEQPPPPPPPPVAEPPRAREVVLLQRNGLPFVAHVSVCTPQTAW